MAAATPLASSSLPPSSSLNTSHSSVGSEGFVVVDKSSSLDENLRVSQTNGEDGVEMKLQNERVLKDGSASHNGLLKRIQCLTKENDELKGVLVKNNNVLEEYFKDLASLQTNQKQNSETLRKGYDQAKDVVKKLREKNEGLKAELKSEQEKNQELEEQLEKLKEEMLNQSSAQGDDKSINPHQLLSLTSEIKRLESEKEKLEINNCKLQDHISSLKRSVSEVEESMEGDECATLISMGSLALQSNQTDLESLHSRCSKLETEKEILQVDLQKLMIEKEQIQQQYQYLEEEHQSVSKHLAELEEARAPDNTTAVDSELVTELSRQLQEQTKSVNTLSEELDAVKQERETFKKRVDELGIELTKEKSKAEEMALKANETFDETPQKGETDGQDLQRLNEEIFILTKERNSYKKKLDALQTHLEAAKASAEEAFGKVEDTELNKKYMELKQKVLMFEKREAELLAKENVLLQENEETQRKQAAENDEIERLRELLQNYQDKDKEAQVAVKEQIASQVALGKEIGRLREQMEMHRSEFKKQLDDVTQKRDAYKAKVEELHAASAEDNKTGEEEVPGDADLKEKYLKVKKQLWHYQRRENYIQDKENDLLEKEKTFDIQRQQQSKDLERHLQNARMKEDALIEEKQKHEKETQHLKKQLSETHEQEVQLLKEELHLKNEELTAVQNSEKYLKEELAKLQQEKQNLLIECEQCKAECVEKEEEGKSLMRQLNEKHKQENFLLREKLRSTELALDSSQNNEEHLKIQVTQLIQENSTLCIESDRLKEELQRQENMYQEHLHKLTLDKDNQKRKADDNNKTLKTQLTKSEAENQKLRTQIDNDNDLIRELQTNNEVSRKKEGELVTHLKESDEHVQKLKEDDAIKEREITELKEQIYYHDKQHEEQCEIQNHQLDQYRRDFEAERAARETQHAEILRLREEVQQLQEQVDQYGHSQMLEMQRRHVSYQPESHGAQPPRTWFDYPMSFFTGRGGGGEEEMPRRQEEPTGFRQQEGQCCPTCGGLFDDFGSLQVHALTCNGVQPPPNQCPVCHEVFPDIDTLEIHAQDCMNFD
ncbi:hypothetical protein P5673_007931 [Acropora cervicornis]|uniref:CCHC NOA-type domain-containing protein n=1 Tax=Acropora cervicornis TaxID=6130 RepID=A0AAD9VBJ4_ACRCE|nr:hypothetical protein P5673_007931 [Acropora cervicornis]